MGVSSYDKSTAHRRLEGEFVALDNAVGVSLLLRQIHALNKRKYDGDYAASDVLIDLDTAVERANLTARESEAIRYVYVNDLTQAEAGLAMGVSRERAKRLCDTAAVKIARIYENWSHRGEGYGVTLATGNEEADLCE